MTVAVNVLYIVGFLDLLGVSMIIPLLTKHSRDLGASPAMAGFIGSVYGFLQLFSSPVIGKWSDTSGRRYVLLCCLFFSSFSYAILGFSSTILLALIARIPAGIFKHSQELAKSYLADIVPKSDHSLIFGRFNSISSIGFIVGPIIGGHLSDLSGGFYLVAMVVTVVFLLNVCLVWFFLPNESTNQDSSNASSQFGEGFSFSDTIRTFSSLDWNRLWDIFLVRFLLSFAVIIYRNDFAATLNYKYGSSGKVIGWMISYSGLVSAFSGLFVGRIAARYNDDSRLLLHSALLQTVTILAMTFAPNVWLLAFLMTPLSIANAIARVSAMNLTLSKGDAHETGALMGLGASVMSLSRMASPFIGGLSQEISSSGPGIVGTVVAAAGAAILFQTSKPKSDHIKVQ